MTLVMNKWLETYAFRINISYQLYIIVAMAVVIFTFLTVSSQAIKAVNENPVNNLKAE